MELNIVTHEEFRAALNRIEALEKANAILKASQKASGDRITTAEAKARTGYSTLYSLKKHFTPVEKNGRFTWSASEIAEFIANQELTKTREAA